VWEKSKEERYDKYSFSLAIIAKERIYAKNPTTTLVNFMAALTLGLSFKALIASSLYFLTKIGSTVPNCQNLFIRLVVRTARISILEKLNDDCTTEKRIILKRSRAAVMLLLLLTTSRQLVTT